MTPSGIEPATFRFVAQHSTLTPLGLVTIYFNLLFWEPCHLTAFVSQGKVTLEQNFCGFDVTAVDVSRLLQAIKGNK